MKHPDIVIATGYEALFAYLLNPDGKAVLIERIDFQSDGQTKVPLLRWDLESSCYRTIVEMIEKILARYQPDSWGLACRSEQYPKIEKLLANPFLNSLIRWIKTDTEEVNIGNVTSRFKDLIE